MEKGDIFLGIVPTTMRVADIFNKLLDEDKFYYVRRELGMINHNACIKGE